ncbi:MAG TPA: CHAT domain-containing protein, partial [Acidobacteria bacterium]|nr:CHAT domain-containing protein [Acidobacteriota bacterium]
QRRYGEADHLVAEAREIREHVAPGNPLTADIVFFQGSVAEAQGRTREAERLWKQAIAMAERMEDELPLSEHELSRFGARFYLYYQTVATHLATNGRGEEAFALIERARARALRSMLLGARAVPAGVPPRLWFEYRRVLHRIERLRSKVAQRAGGGRNAVDEPGLEGEMAPLVQRRDQLVRRIVAAAPRLAGLGNLPSPSAEDIRRGLDPGTVLLSYIAGQDETVLLALTSSGPAATLRTFTIPAGSAELKRRIDILRAFIARGRLSPIADDALLAQGRKLFRLLVAPALEEIEPARRLLIIPDGPLREAPFAAFVLPGERPRFLGTWKPLFFDPSAGAFLALRARRGRHGGGGGVIAFGDPVYPGESEVVKALDLRPLEGSRSEVRRIAARFEGKARVFLGNDASEERLRSLPGGARYLHLAVHAQPDARFPLESALFLSLPARPGAPSDRDGVLHAWEIMDAVRLPARVVTLSGCSTAGGERVPGEGVLGLARAFQYAGASTVVASQWPVADRSACELMDRFYAGLAQGLDTAEALRAARAALAAAPLPLARGKFMDARHPFHWAAFQVIGDWR